MATTLTDEVLAARMHALSDEHRLTILRELAAGPKCVRDLTSRLEDGQSLVSFHLRILLECGLVEARREGRFNCYYVSHSALDQVSTTVAAVRDSIGPGCSAADGQPCCCR